MTSPRGEQVLLVRGPVRADVPGRLGNLTGQVRGHPPAGVAQARLLLADQQGAGVVELLGVDGEAVHDPVHLHRGCVLVRDDLAGVCGLLGRQGDVGELRTPDVARLAFEVETPEVERVHPGLRGDGGRTGGCGGEQQVAVLLELFDVQVPDRRPRVGVADQHPDPPAQHGLGRIEHRRHPQRPQRRARSPDAPDAGQVEPAQVAQEQARVVRSSATCSLITPRRGSGSSVGSSG